MSKKDKIILGIIAAIMLIFATSFIIKTLNKPEIIEADTAQVIIVRNYIKDVYTVTAYCPCRECCGMYAENRPEGKVYTASGKEAKANHTIAAPLPYGTKIYIKGLGVYEVEDRTSDYVAAWYDNKIIDIYCDTHVEAVEIGKKYREIYILKVGE